MASYKYSRITTGPSNKTFERFLDWMYNKTTFNCNGNLTLHEENPNKIRYYPDDLEFGKMYFVGPQYEEFKEGRIKYDFGMYKFVDICFDEEHEKVPYLNDWIKELLVFENENGNQIKIRSHSVVLSRERIVFYHEMFGFELPYFCKKEGETKIHDLTKAEKIWKGEDEDRKRFSLSRFIFDRVLAIIIMLFIGMFCIAFVFDGLSDLVYNIPQFIGGLLVAVPLGLCVLALVLFVIWSIGEEIAKERRNYNEE